eukprot:Pompholyxophrys_punicea_v1_NODE_176_length_2997_cov_13.868117.p3 type:complete len:104 gc:universal NODE_176_length_2997_cov_13.868117:2104-1793(-)
MTNLRKSSLLKALPLKFFFKFLTRVRSAMLAKVPRSQALSKEKARVQNASFTAQYMCMSSQVVDDILAKVLRSSSRLTPPYSLTSCFANRALTEVNSSPLNGT